jgi:hypothetical protein
MTYRLSITEQLNYLCAGFLEPLPEVLSQDVLWRKDPKPTVSEVKAHTSILKFFKEEACKGDSH